MDSVLSRMPAGFFSFNDNGEITSANLTFERMLGYEPGELRQLKIDDILATGGKIYYQTHFFPMLKLQGSVEEVYFKLRAKNGEIVPVLANARRYQTRQWRVRERMRAVADDATGPVRG